MSQDGRYSYAKLAKELNIKASTVSCRVNKMLEEDLISIQAVPNPFKIGYKLQVLITMNVEKRMIDSVCDRLIDNFNISSIAVMYGAVNVLVFAEYPSIDLLRKLVDEELPNIDGVNWIDTLFISKRKKSYEKFFSRESLVDDSVQIDKIDERLIYELRKNGRANLAHFAAEYQISTATVTRRLNALIKKNIIKITVVPNHTKLLGFSAVAYLMIRAEPRKVGVICEQLSCFPEMYNIMTMLNKSNIMAILVLPDYKSLYEFINDKVSLIDGVIEVNSLIRAELKKRTYVYINDAQIRSVITD